MPIRLVLSEHVGFEESSATCFFKGPAFGVLHPNGWLTLPEHPALGQ